MKHSEFCGLADRWYPVFLLGLCGGLGTLLLAGIRFESVITACLLVTGGAVLEWRLIHQFKQSLVAVSAIEQAQFQTTYVQLTECIQELERMPLEFFTIFSGNIDHSRRHTEESIANLTQRFYTLVVQLNQVVAASRDTEITSLDAISDLFANSKGTLHEIVFALEDLLKREETILGQVKGLAQYTDELDSTALEICSVAEKVNILALNAAIKAAKSGEHGLWFAAMANDTCAKGVCGSR